ncbi:MAG: tetratricopeptide repeat protein [Planctomycetota bacterium]
MFRSATRSASAAWLVALGACASGGAPTWNDAPTSDEPMATLDDVTVAEPAVVADDGSAMTQPAALRGPMRAVPTRVQAGRAPGRPHLQPAEQALLASPEFRGRLLESVIPETEIEPERTVEEREVLTEIRQLVAEGKLDEALARAEDEATRPDASAAFAHMAGTLYMQAERYDEAVKALTVATETYPKFVRAWAVLGQARLQQEDFKNAIKALSKVIALGRGDGNTYGLLGMAHAKLDNPVSAEWAFRAAAMFQPDNATWKMGLAQTLYQQRRFGDVAALLGALIVEDPSNPKYWLLQGDAYAQLGEPLEAAKDFEFVDRLGASTAVSLGNLGDIYAREKLFARAVDAHLQRLDRFPDAKAARALLAAQYLTGSGAPVEEARRLVEGIEAMRGADLEAKQRKELLETRARLAAAVGDVDAQVEILEQVVAMDPTDGAALVLLGNIARSKSDLSRAMRYYGRAGDIEATEADAKLQMARIHVQERRYREALELLRRVVDLKESDQVRDYIKGIERHLSRSQR